jgi:hypothetical protein
MWDPNLKWLERGHPFIWLVGNGPKGPQRKRRLRLWYLNILITFSYYSFLIVQSIRVHLNDEETRTTKIRVLFILVFSLFLSVSQIAFLLHRRDSSLSICQHFRLVQSLKSNKVYMIHLSKSKLKTHQIQMGVLLADSRQHPEQPVLAAQKGNFKGNLSRKGIPAATGF